MRVYLLNSGRTLEGYWGKVWTKPKCLLPINDATILDYQIDRFKKLNIDITLVLGYGAKFIEEHCEHIPYPIRYIYDGGWNKEYSIPRTLFDIEDELLNEKDDVIIVHGDLLFNIDLLKQLIDAKNDICKIQNRNMIFKFSSIALLLVLWILREQPEITTLDEPLWRIVREKGIVMAELNPYIWHVDIDRPEVHNQYRRTGLLDGIG